MNNFDFDRLEIFAFFLYNLFQTEQLPMEIVYLKEKYNRGTNKLFVHVRGTTVVVEHDRKRVPYLLKNIWGIY